MTVTKFRVGEKVLVYGRRLATIIEINWDSYYQKWSYACALNKYSDKSRSCEGVFEEWVERR